MGEPSLAIAYGRAFSGKWQSPMCKPRAKLLYLRPPTPWNRLSALVDDVGKKGKWIVYNQTSPLWPTYPKMSSSLTFSLGQWIVNHQSSSLWPTYPKMSSSLTLSLGKWIVDYQSSSMLSPWYDLRDWLGIKQQLSIYLSLLQNLPQNFIFLIVLFRKVNRQLSILLLVTELTPKCHLPRCSL